MTPLFPDMSQNPHVDVPPAQIAATGLVAVILRAEAFIEVALAVVEYRHMGGAWTIFAALFLLPDLGMAGYLVDRRAGALFYNLAHTYVAPALLALSGFMLSADMPCLLALIWAAHIGFDRLAGFGLKYPAAFGATHLGWLGPTGR